MVKSLYDQMNDGDHIIVSRQTAVNLGINQAIAYNQILKLTQSREAITYNGEIRYATTWGELEENYFTFWSRSTIIRLFKELNERGLVDWVYEYDENGAIAAMLFAVNPIEGQG